MVSQYPFPPYTSLVPRVSDFDWVASTDFRFKGYAGFHTGANGSLNLIFPDFEDYTGFHFNPNDLLAFDEETVVISDILWDNAVPLGFALVGILLALGLTVFGIVWCSSKCCPSCCKWATTQNKYCGDENSRSHMRKEKWMRGSLALWLLILFICVSAMFEMNNQFFYDDPLPELDNALMDSLTYMAMTASQITVVMVPGYALLNQTLEEIIADSGTFDKDAFKDATSKSKLLLLDLTQNLERMNSRANATSDPNLMQLDSWIESMTKSVESFEQEMTVLLSRLEHLRWQLRSAGHQLNESATEMNDALDSVPLNESSGDLEDLEETVMNAVYGLFYGIHAVNVFILLIFLTIMLGNILHFFHGAGARRVGSILFQIGLLAIFLSVLILWIGAVVVFFISGGLLVVVPGAFESLGNSNGSLFNPRIHENVTSAESRSDAYVLPSITSILESCKASDSAYHVFDLEPIFHLNEFRTILYADEELTLHSSYLQNKLLLEKFQTLQTQLTSEMEGEESTWMESGILLRKLGVELLVILNMVTNVGNVELEVRRQKEHYISFAENEFREHIGACAPLYNVMTSILHIFTYRLGSPIGGYWFALNITLFLFYPIVITIILILKNY